MTLNDKELSYADEPEYDYFYKKDVKETIKNIELKLLQKYKMASIPIMKIIKEEMGEELSK